VTLHTLVRNTDPATSHLAAASVRPVPNRMRMLRQFARTPQTTEQAAEAAGLLRIGICYWKRVSELAQVGWVTEHRDSSGVPLVLPNRSGRKAMVYAITKEGREALHRFQAQQIEATENV